MNAQIIKIVRQLELAQKIRTLIFGKNKQLKNKSSDFVDPV